MTTIKTSSRIYLKSAKNIETINTIIEAITLKSNIDYNHYINDVKFINEVNKLVTKSGLKYGVYYCGYFETFEVNGLSKNEALKLATVLYCNFNVEFFNTLN